MLDGALQSAYLSTMPHVNRQNLLSTQQICHLVTAKNKSESSGVTAVPVTCPDPACWSLLCV